MLTTTSSSTITTTCTAVSTGFSDPAESRDVTDSKKVAEDAWNAPGWKAAAVEYPKARGGRPLIVEIESKHLKRLRRPLESNVSLERNFWGTSTLKGRAAESAVEALMLVLREGGTKALEQSAVKQRLSELNETQVREIGARLQRLKPAIAQAWDADGVVALISAWTEFSNG
jgi:hypothetical protein